MASAGSRGRSATLVHEPVVEGGVERRMLALEGSRHTAVDP